MNFGRSACIGRFANPSRMICGRLDPVVVHTARGVELGKILDEVTPDFAVSVSPSPEGILLRIATAEDLNRETQHAVTATGMAAAAVRFCEEHGFPFIVLDIETLLDGEHAIVHLLPLDESDPSGLCELLERQFNWQFNCLIPAQREATPSSGCGKPGCGDQAGGCSSCSSPGCSDGGCSRGSVRDGDDMTRQFLELRRRMEELHRPGLSPHQSMDSAS